MDRFVWLVLKCEDLTSIAAQKVYTKNNQVFQLSHVNVLNVLYPKILLYTNVRAGG